MRKEVRIIIWAIIGVVVASLIALFILSCLGFCFTPEAAVYEFYRNNTHIHTDEYDFFLHDETIEEESGEGLWADGHTAVKRYGFLYKKIENPDYKNLVAENGDDVGELFSYEGKTQTYRFIHWTGYLVSAESLPDLDLRDDVTTAVVSYEYFTKNIIYNGENTELLNYCYFVTDEPIETLVINETNVYVENELKRN